MIIIVKKQEDKTVYSTITILWVSKTKFCSLILGDFPKY